MPLGANEPALRMPLTAIAVPLRLLALLASIVAALAAVWLLTAIPFGRAIWDYLFLLDGSYRISLGQVPHIDFTSPVGPLSLYLTHAAELLFPGKHPFVGLHALMWILVVPAMVFLAPRFRSTLAFLAALALLMLVMFLPMTLDQTHLSEISYFASYNRFATGILFIAGLWLVLPKQRHDWVLLAFLLAILFFLKITAAAVVLGIVVAATILGRVQLRQLLLTLVSFGLILGAVELATGIVSAYLGDIADMSGVNRGGAVYAVLFAAFRSWAPLLAGAALLAVIVVGATRTGQLSFRRPLAAATSLAARLPFAVDAALLILAALLAESQNTGGLGLIAAAALFFHPDAWRGAVPRIAVAGVLLAALVLPVLDMTFDRTLTAVRRERDATTEHPVAALYPGTRVPLSTIEGARFFQRVREEWHDFASAIQDKGFFIDHDPTSNYVAAQLAWATSAVEAGRRFVDLGYGSASDRYATLAFADPFARMLGLTPATGTNIVIQAGRTVPDFTPEQADHYLAAATGVFADTCILTAEPTAATPFRATLAAQFELLPLTRCWDYYRRIAPPESVAR